MSPRNSSAAGASCLGVRPSLLAPLGCAVTFREEACSPFFAAFVFGGLEAEGFPSLPLLTDLVVFLLILPLKKSRDTALGCPCLLIHVG